MATIESSAIAHSSIGYVERGRNLYLEHADHILKSYREGTWLIPSGSTEGKVYEVRLGRHEFCECSGYGYHGHCSHVVAATVAKAKSFSCDACGERVSHREMVEVSEEHLGWTLAFFLGEMVCLECAGDHGLL